MSPPEKNLGFAYNAWSDRSTQSVSLLTCMDGIWWRHKCHLSSKRDSPNFAHPLCGKGPGKIYAFPLNLRGATNANRGRWHLPLSYKPWATELSGLAWGNHHKSRKKVKFACLQLLSLSLHDSCISLIVPYKITTISQQPQQLLISHSLVCSHFGWLWFRQWF